MIPKYLNKGYRVGVFEEILQNFSGAFYFHFYSELEGASGFLADKLIDNPMYNKRYFLSFLNTSLLVNTM